VQVEARLVEFIINLWKEQAFIWDYDYQTVLKKVDQSHQAILEKATKYWFKIKS